MDLGVSWQWKKSTEPITCLTFLGVELDTSQMQIRLLAAEMSNLMDLGWGGQQVLRSFNLWLVICSRHVGW